MSTGLLFANGATLAEITEATGWQKQHSARLRQHLGKQVRREDRILEERRR
jgi:hypothetical protein